MSTSARRRLMRDFKVLLPHSRCFQAIAQPPFFFSSDFQMGLLVVNPFIEDAV